MAQTKIVVDQLENESMQDFIKFLVFLELGSTRTLNLAYTKYYEYNAAHAVSVTWQALAEKYRWVARASEYEKLHLTIKPASAPVTSKQKRSRPA